MVYEEVPLTPGSRHDPGLSGTKTAPCAAQTGVKVDRVGKKSFHTPNTTQKNSKKKNLSTTVHT